MEGNVGQTRRMSLDLVVSDMYYIPICHLNIIGTPYNRVTRFRLRLEYETKYIGLLPFRYMECVTFITVHVPLYLRSKHFLEILTG
jgi:hypothetical protein